MRIVTVLSVVFVFVIGLLSLRGVQDLAQEGNDQGGNVALFFNVLPNLFLFIMGAIILGGLVAMTMAVMRR